jgi:7-keto-8-aminopelargonate synthetase-like enzyme
MSEALKEWGLHSGASRIFYSIELCAEAERRLASWLEVEETLIFPSVTIANVGLIPGLAGKGELLVIDRNTHDSVHQGARIALANGAICRELSPCRPDVLHDILEQEGNDACVLTIDGVYSMTGASPPLAELDEVVRAHGGVLYVDDAHGTGVVGEHGRGATHQALGSLENVLMVGSLSKGFSCMGAFVTCTEALKPILKMKSSPYIFSGPVPPPYLAAICAVCDILASPEYDTLLHRLREGVKRLVEGIRSLGFIVSGGRSPIVAVRIGDIEQTLMAGKWLFDRGYYVQSVTYPAVPINGGLLRVQVSANHSAEAIDGLLNAFSDLKAELQRLQSGSGEAV